MQFRLPASIIIFLGSYLPLALILLAQDFEYSFVGHTLCSQPWHASSACVLPLRHPEYSLTVFFACLICFCLSLVALATTRPKIQVEITEASYIPAELMSYTLPYVVSFMSLDYKETGKFVGLIIFLAWMFWITFRSGQLILNPLLIAFGWRLYNIQYVFPGDVKIRNGRALCSGEIEAGQRHNHTVVQDVIIIRPSKVPEEQ